MADKQSTDSRQIQQLQDTPEAFTRREALDLVRRRVKAIANIEAKEGTPEHAAEVDRIRGQFEFLSEQQQPVQAPAPPANVPAVDVSNLRVDAAAGGGEFGAAMENLGARMRQEETFSDISIPASAVVQESSNEKDMFGQELIHRAYAAASQDPDFKVPPEFADQLRKYATAAGGDILREKFDKQLDDMDRAFVRASGKIAREAGDQGNIGLIALDQLTDWKNNFFLMFASPEKKAELRRRALPAIKLEGEEYDSSVSVAWKLWTDKVYNNTEKFRANVLDLLGKDESADNLRNEIAIRQRLQGNDINKGIQATHGDWLLAHDIVLSHMDEADVEKFYQFVNKGGPMATAAKLGVAMGDAGGEIFGDPMLIAAAIPYGKIAQLARLAIPAAKRATITSDVAKRVGSLGSWMDAEKAATGALKQAYKDLDLGAAGAENLKDINRLEEQVRAAKQAVASFQDAGPNTPVLLRDARVKPSAADMSTTRELTQVDDVADELVKARVRTGIEDVDPTLEWYRQDALEELARRGGDVPGKVQGELFTRAALNGDGVEEWGDAAARLVKSGGGAMDDAVVGPLHPEDISTIRAMPELGSKRSLISMDAIKATNEINASQQPVRALRRGATLGQGVEHHMVQEIRALRGSLKTAKKVLAENKGLGKQFVEGTKAQVSQIEEQLAILKAQRAKVKAKGLGPEAKKFDDTWLPPATKGVHESPEVFNNWLSRAGDRAARGLYPGSMRLRMATSNIGGKLWNTFREPQRFFETFDPDTWEKVRTSFLRHEWYQNHWTNTITDIAEEVGIVGRRSKFNPKKHFSPVTVKSPEKAKAWYRLLNTVEGSEVRAGVEAAVEAEFGAEGLQQLLGAEKKMRRYLDYYADVQGVSRTDRYLEGYIHNFYNADWFKAGARPPEFGGMPEEVRTWASHLMDRSASGARGAELIEDPFAALDIMGRAAHKKLIMEPVYNDVLRAGQRIQATHPNSDAAVYTRDLIDNLMGKPGTMSEALDRAIMSKLPGSWNADKVDRGLLGLTSALWAGTIAGNPRYPFMQVASGVATTTGEHGLFRTSRGLMRMMTPEGQAMARETGVFRSFETTWEQMSRGGKMEKAASGFSNALADAPLPVSVNMTENYIRGTTSIAAIDAYLTKFGFTTWAEAKAAGWGNRIAFEALRSSEEVNHLFGILGRPPILQRTLGKGPGAAGTQFMSFVPKQTETLLSWMDKDPGAMLRYLAMSGVIARHSAADLGIDATKYVGFGYVPEEFDTRVARSPAVQTFIGLINYADALSSDEKSARVAGQKLADNVKILIPLWQAFAAQKKARTRIFEGVDVDKKGRPLRAVDLNIRPGGGSAFKPLGAGRGEALGSDLASTLTGIPSLRERLTRMQLEAGRHSEQARLNDIRDMASDLTRAIRAGDQLKLADLTERLAREGIPLTGSVLKNEYIAQQVVSTIRQVQEAPDDLKLEMMERMRTLGIFDQPIQRRNP